MVSELFMSNVQMYLTNVLAFKIIVISYHPVPSAGSLIIEDAQMNLTNVIACKIIVTSYHPVPCAERLLMDYV